MSVNSIESGRFSGWQLIISAWTIIALVTITTGLLARYDVPVPGPWVILGIRCIALVAVFLLILGTWRISARIRVTINRLLACILLSAIQIGFLYLVATFGAMWAYYVTGGQL